MAARTTSAMSGTKTIVVRCTASQGVTSSRRIG
jgi:hypothetical protein